MLDLSPLKNSELKSQITGSAIFAALPKADQAKYIKKMATLPPKQQEKFAQFFATESQTNAPQDKTEQFLNTLEDLKHQYLKLARQDKESTLTKEEKKQQEKLLDQLNSL